MWKEGRMGEASNWVHRDVRPGPPHPHPVPPGHRADNCMPLPGKKSWWLSELRNLPCPTPGDMGSIPVQECLGATKPVCIPNSPSLYALEPRSSTC